MFDLEKAIAEWRDQTTAHITDEHLEELETHLRDAVDHGINTGFSKEDAFVLALHRLGDTDLIGKELAIEAGLTPPKPQKPIRRFKAWKAFVIPAIACLLALVWLEWLNWLHHRSYSATAVAEVTPIPYSTELQMFSHQTGTATTAVDIANEIEVFRSGHTLFEVVNTLGLDERWEVTMWNAAARLKKGLTVQRIRESDLIKIGYHDSSPQLAMDCANAFIKAYRDIAMGVWRQKRSHALDMLQKQLKDQEDKVEEARLKMLDLAERYRITPQSEELLKADQTELNRLYREAIVSVASALDRAEAEQRIVRLKETLEDSKDEMMNHRRKVAEYQEAEGEFELQRRMLHTMQQTFAQESILSTMPVYPVRVHSDAITPFRRDSPNWWPIFFHAAGKGWGWMLFTGLLGILTVYSWTRWRQGREMRATQGGKVAADEEISWA